MRGLRLVGERDVGCVVGARDVGCAVGATVVGLDVGAGVTGDLLVGFLVIVGHFVMVVVGTSVFITSRNPNSKLLTSMLSATISKLVSAAM